MTGQRCTDDAGETRGNCRGAPAASAVRRKRRAAPSSLSSTAAGVVVARGRVRARGGVDGLPRDQPVAQGWRAPLAIRCRGPLAVARSVCAGSDESAAASTLERTRFDPPAAWELPAGYSVSVFRGRRLDWGASAATLRSSAGFAVSVPQRHRPRSAFGGALNFCLIKHLQNRAGEKYYRCEARAHGRGGPLCYGG